MSAVRGFLGSVWHGVQLPLYIVWAIVVRVASSVRDFFWPRLCKNVGIDLAVI